MFKFVYKYKMPIICALLILAICFLHALDAQYTCDFFPINGTWQNYNPVRRALSGQVPFRDYNIYLGFGHLILGSISTAIWGGTFAASLSAFSFLTILSLAFLSLCVGKSILQSWKETWIFTLLIMTVEVSSFLMLMNGSILCNFRLALDCCLSPGISARFIRGAAPVLFILLLFLGRKLTSQVKIYKVASEQQKKMVQLTGYSLIGGLIFAYSNDYGICSWLCFGIMLGLVIWAREKSILRAFIRGIQYIVISLISLGIFVLIFTQGHFLEWFNSTFGTAGYQTWYYMSEHSHYLFNLDSSPISIMQGLLVFYYIVKLFQFKGDSFSVRRYGVPAVINMTAVFASNEYKLLAGSDMREVSYSLCFLTLFFEGLRYVITIFKKYGKPRITKFLAIAVMIASCGWLISDGCCYIRACSATDRGVYIDELGGYLTLYGNDLQNTSEFLGDKKVFATYASAIEDITDQYQPSKSDYIIHVLGSNAREEYLQCFHAKNFDYVATIRERVTDWEYWVRGANWFFYRELFRNYHPVYSNSYELFWEENTEENTSIPGDQVDLKIQKVDHSTYKLIITGDQSIHGVADINLSYSAQKNNASPANLLMWFYCVNVVNTSDNAGLYNSIKDQFNLPAQGDVQIPIQIINGYGEVTITSQPLDNTDLCIESASVNEVYSVLYDYIKIYNIQPADNGKCVLIAANSAMDQKKLENSSSIEIGGLNSKIISIETCKETIKIIVDSNYEEISQAKGQYTYFHIIREEEYAGT